MSARPIGCPFLGCSLTAGRLPGVWRGGFIRGLCAGQRGALAGSLLSLAAHTRVRRNPMSSCTERARAFVQPLRKVVEARALRPVHCKVSDVFQRLLERNCFAISGRGHRGSPDTNAATIDFTGWLWRGVWTAAIPVPCCRALVPRTTSSRTNPSSSLSMDKICTVNFETSRNVASHLEVATS